MSAVGDPRSANFPAQTFESPSVRRQLGKYHLIAMIGRGGMGDIYLAMARGPAGFKKLVVVKSLRMTTEDDETLRRMILDEGRLAAHLAHPNVVQIFDVGLADDNPYIAMEYLDGQPLSKIFRTVGRLDPPIAARIASDVLAGLHYAHELCGFDGKPLHMVHRDLSPPNIIVTYDGVVKLMDFGIAKAALPSRALTDIGTLKGKVSYMAPEQATREDIDRRVDIFAMGVVLWEILVGKRFVADTSAAAALRQLLLGPLPLVSSQLPGIDSGLDRIVARALERDPDARYSTALEMREDLEEYLARCGSVVRSEDLSRLLTKNFAVQRAHMQEVIQTCIAAADSDSASRLPVIPRADSTADEPRGSLPPGDYPNAQVNNMGSIPPISTSHPDEADFLRQLNPVSRMKKPLLVGGVALLSLGLLAGIVYTLHKPPTLGSLPTATSATGASAPATAAAATATSTALPKAAEPAQPASNVPGNPMAQPRIEVSVASTIGSSRHDHAARPVAPPQSPATLTRASPSRSTVQPQINSTSSQQSAALTASVNLPTDDRSRGLTTNNPTRPPPARRAPLVEDGPRAPLLE